MLQYCVLYAKIQKLNMSNIMDKTNSDNEVYEESDLPTRPWCRRAGLSMQMCLPGPGLLQNYRAQKRNYNGHPSDNGRRKAHNGKLVKLETNVKFRALRRARGARHCSRSLRRGNKHQRQGGLCSSPASDHSNVLQLLGLWGF